MPAGDHVMKQIIQEELMNVNTAMPCRVVSFSDGKASVQPLFMKKVKGESPKKRPLIQNVPTLKQRFKVDGVTQTYEPVYEVGDVVFVAFAQRALDKLSGGQEFYPGYSRKHSIHDAVILGVMN